ncbi:hypothetical protein PAPYR_10224 [Paratrimastix pyriformis]|uniref:Uncharacterized protein n=1 Tax=Paratrimastix pyriformis TaxID=342808 RepID=A0ABQ8U6F0_9EUKA|nr:hypothetical protein PAPYR_10224 [Paratrimastix pyriformis]
MELRFAEARLRDIRTGHISRTDFRCLSTPSRASATQSEYIRRDSMECRLRGTSEWPRGPLHTANKPAIRGAGAHMQAPSTCHPPGYTPRPGGPPGPATPATRAGACPTTPQAPQTQAPGGPLGALRTGMGQFSIQGACASFLMTPFTYERGRGMAGVREGTTDKSALRSLQIIISVLAWPNLTAPE